MAKRLFDIIFAGAGLLFMSPIFLLLAIAIKLESKGGVFYRGERIGKGGKTFRIFKFRSMVINAEASGAASTTSSDARITKVGRLIRKFKIDEFSQLINVLKGDMSLVGPRPEVPKFLELFQGEEKRILDLRPGITDWASIKFHNEGEILQSSGISDADEAYLKLIRPEKVGLQMKYIRERNLLLDIKIIFFTFLTLVSTRLGKGPVGVPKAE